jgi:hypothetical protein
VAKRPVGGRTKYGNKRVTVDGINFASKAEARRYCDLLLLVRAKTIDNLQLQPRFPLVVQGCKIATYVADFSYFDNTQKQQIVEDVKSLPTRTQTYIIKRKLVQALYGIEIKEIYY